MAVRGDQIAELLAMIQALEAKITVKRSEKMINAKFEIYRTRTGQYRWRLKAGNGEIIAHGESYKRREKCHHAIKLVQKSDLAEIVRL